MKKILLVLAATLAIAVSASAGDKPVTFKQLPAAAQEFITSNFPADKISYATVDDDFVRPDYTVVFASGLKVQFEHSGALEKVEARNTAFPTALVPVQIRDYVKQHYPEAGFLEYEIGKRHYEVKLSNRLELTFNNNFILVEIDD